jgi:hypothetical protein
MGLNKFNQWGSGSSGNTLLYRPKISPVTNLLYGGGDKIRSIPVIRAGVNNKVFLANVSTVEIKLLSYTSLGVESTVATITFTTYLAGSQAVATHLNSADTCLYILLLASSSYQLIKINDTSGAVTAIGSSFTPTTAANWPTGMSTGFAGMQVDVVSGHIQVRYNGYTHLINKTTGAIVSQDTAIILGSYLARGVFYVTQDGTIGLSNSQPQYGIGAESRAIPCVISSSYGLSGIRGIPASQDGLILAASETQYPISQTLHLVDSDKLCHSILYTSTGTNTFTPTMYLRSEFDKYLKSCVDLTSGVL